MKKSILVLSALLTLAVSGICLQSCSSEYDEYTTEEYGSYTEEEIDAIMALAEKYGVEVEFGSSSIKKSLDEIEEMFISSSMWSGSYDLRPQKNEDGTIQYVGGNRDQNISRGATRTTETVELNGVCECQFVTLTIEWNSYKEITIIPEVAPREVENYEFSTYFSSDNICFSGEIKLTSNGISSDTLIKLRVSNGVLDTKTSRGSYNLIPVHNI